MADGDEDSSSSGASGNSAPATVLYVSLKLIPYWPADPLIWFAQVQAQFDTKGISSQKTKHDYVVSSLSPDIATEVHGLIIKPPTSDQYKALKAALIQRITASQQLQIRQLFQGEELGDRKHIQLLRRMEQLLGNQGSEHTATMLKLFLQHLPSNVRMILASTPGDNTVKDLVTLADKIVEVTGPFCPTPINNVSTQEGDSQLATELTKLREEVAYLKKIVRFNSCLPASRGHHRSHSLRSDCDSPAPRQASDLCWYHERFLVDTGAEVSVITPSVLDKQCLQKLTLQAANNSSISTYGKRSLTLGLNLRRSFQWVFVIADIAMPILGADFLHFGLLVDMQYNRQIDNNSFRGERSTCKTTGSLSNVTALFTMECC
uniref:Peptidase A2 domain-containing protein n=1 Tax=Amphimedon queenslandica TaxID=400682 RepID=A0A1X7UWZ2_AMPQE